MSARFYRNPDGTGFAGGLPWVLAKGGAPERRPRGPAEQGSGSVGDATTALMDDRAAHPATGSHLPSEATAPPFAVAFASSPFAHPIPQSRRRASGDLFSGSLRLILCHSPCPSDSNAFVLYHVFFA
jgi:hypothetical protein